MTTQPGEDATQYQVRYEPPQAQGMPASYEPPQAQGMPTSYEPPQAQGLPVPYQQPQAQGWPAPPMQQAYGQGLAYQQVQPHSAGLAVVASFFIPGLGSMLNEQVGKGIGILAAYIVSVILVFFLVGIIAAPAVWIWGMVAANNDAHKWNRAHGIMS
jgi:TM2 domain-containing membrane protein YozV